MNDHSLNKRRANKLKQEKLNYQGFTLLEILLVVILLALAVVPMLKSFRPSLTALQQAEKTVIFKQQSRWTLNRLFTLDFSELADNENGTHPVNLITLLGSSNEAEKEEFFLQGQSYLPEVSIRDASSGQGGLLEIKVSVGSVSLQTLKAEH
jgi:prepilin-type N-terminal cleavage/methylation domain-containing protein